jgi:hypothetical protein
MSRVPPTGVLGIHRPFGFPGEAAARSLAHLRSACESGGAVPFPYSREISKILFLPIECSIKVAK